MTDTTTLAPTDAEILAKWGAPAPASHEALTTALAACRDAFPVPASGSAAEFEWQGAMTDPLGVPAYVRACAAPPAQEARVPLSAEQQRCIAEAHNVAACDEYFNARPQIDYIANRRIFEAGFSKGYGITAAQKETP